MASSLIGKSVKSARNFAAQAAVSNVQPLPAQSRENLVMKKVAKRGIIASIENDSPVSHLAILARAGCRYETFNNIGASHMLRLTAGLATKDFSEFGLTRTVHQFGGQLFCQTGREHILYGITAMRDNVQEAFDVLRNVALEPCFRQWEIDSLNTRLLTELNTKSTSVLAMELLHQAAFRNSGLGNSLYIPDHQINHVSQADKLHEFLKSTHTTSRLAYIGVGVDSHDLDHMVKNCHPDEGAGVSNTGSYGGGEVRQETGASLAYIAVAGSGAKIGSPEAVALGIAQYIMGSNPGIKYGTNASSHLDAVVKGAGGSGKICAINVNYSDSGLFGFFLIEEAEKAGTVLKAVTKSMRSLKVTDQDVENAKKRAKSAVLMSSESNGNLMEDIGLQVLLTENYVSAKDAAAAIDKVTTKQVQSAISDATKSKASMSAVGGLRNVPYLDQL